MDKTIPFGGCRAICPTVHQKHYCVKFAYLDNKAYIKGSELLGLLPLHIRYCFPSVQIKSFQEDLMSTIEEIGKVAETKVTSFMDDKPVWIFWIAYTVLVGALFGIFYAIMYMLALKWWIMAIVLILAGVAWGTFAYFNKEQRKKEANA